MKIQLFVPPQGYIAQRWVEGGASMPPLGILYLAAVLEREGIDVQVVPADVLKFGWKEVEASIRSFKPDIVGGTTTSENRFDGFHLVEMAKKIDPGIVTVLGGPHISMAGRDAMEGVGALDIAVVGEGERTILELAETLNAEGSLDTVRGIFYRKKRDVFFSGPREAIANLDELPFPARHLVPMEKYHFYVNTPDGKKRKAQNIMTSRGCPFNCYFCATPVNWGRKMRGFSTERVLAEIEHLITEYGAEFIWFYDDTFNYDKRRVHRIMDSILERSWNIKFCCEFRIDLVDKPLLEKMVKSGLVWAHFGIEAGNARVRKKIVGKNIEIEAADRFVEWGRELGFVPNAFMIFSHYTETWAEARESIQIMERMKNINPDTEISTAILHVYPGTPLERIAKDVGIVPRDFMWSRKKDMKRVDMLPAAQGYVPLFKDRLSWFQIAELVMRWSADRKRVVSGSKFRSGVKSVSSIRDVAVAAVFFLVLLKHKIKRFFGKGKRAQDVPRRADVGTPEKSGRRLSG
ncbi:MAG: B12-binding domain-containing radical SAM protein [Candidatus Aminicenantes bacterium]|nr:B12-binding domain-containing radical SAM protein [Candidatus Aminicenantes bacterium]